MIRANISMTPEMVPLHMYPHAFHLTGSRFFGTDTEKSDTDFVASYSKEVADWLAEQGYKRILAPSEMYDEGIYTKEVWRHDKFNIEIQLTENLDAKLYARDVIKRYWGYTHAEMKRRGLDRNWLWWGLMDIHIKMATILETEESPSTLDFEL